MERLPEDLLVDCGVGNRNELDFTEIELNRGNPMICWSTVVWSVEERSAVKILTIC